MGFFSKNNSNLTETEVLEALRAVIDPDLHKDVVSLGMIKNVKIDDKNLSFTFELTTPSCPLKINWKMMLGLQLKILQAKDL
jgi:ATP-binding protein involved in chromosome partitioning